MAGDQAIDLGQPAHPELSDGRDARLAVLMVAKWRAEIERAIDRVKKPVKRSELDRWFRKQWYRCQAIRLKHERRLAWEKANQCKIGEHGGDENGGRFRKTWGATRRSDWDDAVRRGPTASAVQEREESARIRGFRERAGQEDV